MGAVRAVGTAGPVRGVEPERLAGGRGLTWRVGDVVLRPLGDVEESIWKAQALADIRPDPGFRTARPVATVEGGWVHGGWEAWERLSGSADETRVEDVIAAGVAFHAAVAGLERPEFIATSDDPWSRADRMAWEEDVLPRDRLLDRLAAEFAPVSSPSQVIHGDLLGNVLFAPGEPPAVIDWAPYWRPAAFGAAIAAVDAVCWHGHPADGLAALGTGLAEWRQLVVRAMAFRMATLHLLDAWSEEMAARHEPVIDAIVRWR
ncbi:hypothetical protein ASF23_04095 [Curtobacterium sp. Leaf261]|nr:hypothetical protein ASF23_04095 [Curtobacterium sp. Leaf261]